MRYLACPQGTAEWVLGKPALVDGLHDVFGARDAALAVRDCEFVEGPLRLSASADGGVVAFWNADYLSGTGDEPWGFVRLEGQFGIFSDRQISREVFERCLYVINQRLQGLFIDGAFIHRSYPNGAHTCMAGRGTRARQFSIGYFERVVEGTGPARAVICVGPGFDFHELSRAAELNGRELQRLVEAANALSAPGRKKSTCSQDILPDLRRLLSPYVTVDRSSEYGAVEVATADAAVAMRDRLRAVGLTYDEWTKANSPLSEVQRRILESDAIERHPLRIIGPGGSGKTLLMQLLALRVLQRARLSETPVRVLYVVHNSAMAKNVSERFSTLEGTSPLRDEQRILEVSTLTDYATRQLALEHTSVINADAQAAKAFQLEQVETALKDAMAAHKDVVASSELLSVVAANPELLPTLSRLISSEISIAIKGHGLEADERRYVQSERKLSRLHGLLTPEERRFVYDVYQRYHTAVFETFGVLDTDDVALSLLGRLRTPIWELKRRELGYDFVFVDETQLFNENERRLLPLLTRGRRAHMPIVLALDEAQDVHAQATAGLATLGIPDIASESLGSVHRSTRSIVRLAFFVIQRSTDLFGPDFPDFTSIAEHMEEDSHPLASPPRIDVAPDAGRNLGKYVVKRIRELRKANLWQIAVICHADVYWEILERELKEAELPLHVIVERGERLSNAEPLVVLTQPAFAGGQEFDAVILVGLEQGMTPPRVVGNDALAAAVEQQALREMYLAITRARYRLMVVLGPGTSPNAVIAEAERAGLLTRK